MAYAASQITLLTSLGDVATANQGAGSDLLALRRAVERDRYGLMAYVLMARDRCTPSACRGVPLADRTRQIAANMDDRVYENLVMRYAPSWNAPPSRAPACRGAAAVGPHGQTDQRRIPDRGLHPAGQHHDARAAARGRAEAAGRHCAAPRRVRPRRHRQPAQAAAKKPRAAADRRAPVQLAPTGRGAHS